MLFRPSSLRNREASRCFAKFGLPVVNFVPPWGPLDPENAPTSFEFINFAFALFNISGRARLILFAKTSPLGGLRLEISQNNIFGRARIVNKLRLKKKMYAKT